LTFGLFLTLAEYMQNCWYAPEESFNHGLQYSGTFI